MHLILKNTQQVRHLHIYGICRLKCSFIWYGHCYSGVKADWVSVNIREISLVTQSTGSWAKRFTKMQNGMIRGEGLQVCVLGDLHCYRCLRWFYGMSRGRTHRVYIMVRIPWHLMCSWEYCLAPCDRTIPFGVYNFRHSGVGFVVWSRCARSWFSSTLFMGQIRCYIKVGCLWSVCGICYWSTLLRIIKKQSRIVFAQIVWRWLENTAFTCTYGIIQF